MTTNFKIQNTCVSLTQVCELNAYTSIEKLLEKVHRLYDSHNPDAKFEEDELHTSLATVN